MIKIAALAVAAVESLDRFRGNRGKIVFNPIGETNGSILGPAMEIDNKEDAEKYFNDYVSWIMLKFDMSREDAADRAVANLKGYSMFYDEKIFKRMNRVFGKCFNGYYDRYAR